MSQRLRELVLYMRPLRQVFCRLPAELSAKIVVLSDVRRPGVIILALCGLLERAAHCIKRSGTIRLQPICPALTRPASLFLADEADHDDPLISVLAPLRSTLCGYAVTASKWVSSFQIRPNSAASLRATATRARFGPRRFSTLRPQLLSAEGLLTVVNSTFAAS